MYTFTHLYHIRVLRSQILWPCCWPQKYATKISTCKKYFTLLVLCSPSDGSIIPLPLPVQFSCFQTISYIVSTLYLCCIYAVSMLYVHCIYAVSMLYLGCIYTVSTLYLRCIYTVSMLYLHCIYTVSMLYLGCIYTVSRLYLHCI